MLVKVLMAVVLALPSTPHALIVCLSHLMLALGCDGGGGSVS